MAHTASALAHRPWQICRAVSAHAPRWAPPGRDDRTRRGFADHARQREIALLLTRGALVRPMGSDTFATPVHGERVELHAQPLSLAPVHFAPVHFLFTVIFFHKFWKNERGRRLINTGRACTQAAGLSATHVGARGTAGDGGARPE